MEEGSSSGEEISMETWEDTCQFIEKLAQAFSTYDMTRHSVTLQTILQVRGILDAHGHGIAHLVVDTSRYGPHHDPVMPHALASAWCGPERASSVEAPQETQECNTVS